MMLRCCLCQSLGASYSDHDEERLGPLLDHAVIHTAQVNRYSKTNIFKIFADCFPETAAKYTIREMVDSMEASENGGSNGVTERKTAGVRSSKIPIYVQCQKILEAYCDKDQRRFQCGVCDELVVLRDRRCNVIDTRYAVYHLLSHHMDIKPFRCRHCDHATRTRGLMVQHVKVAHKVPNCRSFHFVNRINAHQKEICEMVATCFGKKQWKASKNDSPTMIKITKQHDDATPVADDNGNQSTTYQGKKNRSDGRSMITAHCRQTVAPYSTEKHRFECAICGRLVALRSMGYLHPYLALQHALAHMDIKPFRCRYCAVATKLQCDMCKHVKSAHKLAASSTTHYINDISAHEKEICEMITSCFGKKNKPTSGINKSVEISLQLLQDTKDD